MTWHTGPLALFDTETTGVDPHRDRIVTAALIIVEPHRDLSWLLNPGIPIPQEATDITAALSWMVDSGETACRLSRRLRLSLAQWQQLRDAIGAVELAGRAS